MALNTTPKDKTLGRAQRTYKTRDVGAIAQRGWRWWEEKDEKKRAEQLCATVGYLKEGQNFRQRHAAQFARLYGGQSLYSFVGSNMSKLDTNGPLNPSRPTFNLVSSVVDTLVSKLTENKPRPVFLCDNSDYRERNLAKKLNNVILGMFYEAKMYENAEFILTDALVQGTGCLKVFERDKKVCIERRLLTELFVDLQESAYGDPRRLYEVQLMDREVVESLYPDYRKEIAVTEQSYLDSSAETSRSVADLVMVVEGWALPSAPDAEDGAHMIAVTNTPLFNEKWTKDNFPFVFLHHKRRQLGFWSMGTAENLMGTQLELNSLLDVISKAIKLFGVPRVWIEEGSKINTANISNKIATVGKYRGTAPIFATVNSNADDLYQERQRIIDFGYQQEGLSMLAATSQKPAGLNSGEAQRVYNDTNSERFQALERRYSNFFVEAAHVMIELAVDIAKREGNYETVFVDRRAGARQIELPDFKKLEDPFVIQTYTESSLPKDPAGRIQTVTEWIQSNMVSIEDGMRLLDFPDLTQIETLKNANQERIYKQLDDIVEDGKYVSPDQFMFIPKCEEIVTQYINLYATCNLEERKMQLLRDWFAQLQDLKQAAQPPPPMGAVPGQANTPQNGLAVPQPVPQSAMLPQGSAPPPA